MRLSIYRRKSTFAHAIFFAACVGSWFFLVKGMQELPVLRNVWSPALASNALDLLLCAILGSALALYLVWARKPIVFLFGIAIASAACFIAVFGPLGFLGGLLVVFCCFVFGCMVSDLTKSEVIPVIDIFAIGFAAVILLLTLVGLSQIDMRAIFGGLILISLGGTALNPSLRKQIRTKLSLTLPSLTSELYPWSLLIPTALTVFALLYYAANAALPDGAWDPLVMHSMIATQILREGHWNFDSTQYAFAAWPLGVDYLYTFAMALGGELSAKILNLLIFGALIIQLYQLSAELYSRFVARCTLILFLSIPLALVVTASLFVENTLAFLTLAAVRMLLLQNAQKEKIAFLGLAIIIGALCVVKLHGLMIAVPIVLLACVGQKWRSLSQKDLKLVGGTVFICALISTLPYAFAWRSTGNPVFMFKNSFFHSPFWSPTDFVDSRWIGKLSPYLLYRMTFRSNDYMEALPGAIGFSFMAFVIPGLVAVCIKPRWPTTVFMIVVLGYMLILLPQMQYIRYFYPIFPILVLICAASIERFLEVPFVFIRPVVLFFVVSVALFGFFKLPSGAWAQTSADLAALFDTNRREALIVRQAPERLVNDYINSISRTPPRVLYATEPYGAFLKGTPVYIDWYNYDLNSALLKAVKPEEIKSILEAQKLDFIIVNHSSDIDLYQKVGLYAQNNLSLLTTLGPLSVYAFSQ